MATPLPIFTTQPDETTVLQPAVITYCASENVDTYVIDGVFDLLLTSRISRIDSYLEIKVRLKSQGSKCVITPAQWRLLNSHSPTSTFENNYRVLIYDQNNGGQYALATASHLQSGITKKKPKNNSYITNNCLKELGWKPPHEISNDLLIWVNRQIK